MCIQFLIVLIIVLCLVLSGDWLSGYPVTFSLFNPGKLCSYLLSLSGLALPGGIRLLLNSSSAVVVFLLVSSLMNLACTAFCQLKGWLCIVLMHYLDCRAGVYLYHSATNLTDCSKVKNACASCVTQEFRPVSWSEIGNKHCLWLCECRSYATRFCSVYGVAYPYSTRANIPGRDFISYRNNSLKTPAPIRFWLTYQPSV